MGLPANSLCVNQCKEYLKWTFDDDIDSDSDNDSDSDSDKKNVKQVCWVQKIKKKGRKEESYGFPNANSELQFMCELLPKFKNTAWLDVSKVYVIGSTNQLRSIGKKCGQGNILMPLIKELKKKYPRRLATPRFACRSILPKQSIVFVLRTVNETKRGMFSSRQGQVIHAMALFLVFVDGKHGEAGRRIAVIYDPLVSKEALKLRGLNPPTLVSKIMAIRHMTKEIIWIFGEQQAGEIDCLFRSISFVERCLNNQEFYNSKVLSQLHD